MQASHKKQSAETATRDCKSCSFLPACFMQPASAAKPVLAAPGHARFESRDIYGRSTSIPAFMTIFETAVEAKTQVPKENN